MRTTLAGVDACLLLLMTIVPVPTYSQRRAKPLAPPSERAPEKEKKLCGDIVCPVDWLPFGDHCYLFFKDSTKSFHDAKSHCNNEHSYLVRVESENENNWLIQQLYIQDVSTSYFTGATDLVQENSFFWESDNKAITFSSFSGNNADNLNCVAFGKDSNSKYQWMYKSCTETNKFICEASAACMIPDDEDDNGGGGGGGGFSVYIE